MMIAKFIDGEFDMIRGTTPVNVFYVDEDLTSAEVIFITYAQAGKVIIEKDIDDIEVTDERLEVTLTQEDTLKLTEREVQIQIRARWNDGTAIASNIITTTVQNILKDGEI